MSNIFDALQRSEAENSGAELTGLLEAAELLRRAERRATSQWEAETGSGRREPVPPAREPVPPVREPLLAVSEKTVAATLEMPPAPEPVTAPAVVEGHAEFQTISLPLEARNRLMCFTNPDGMAAEAFRMLSVRLRHLRRERPLHKVLITSSIPQEGKSTMAVNLACSLAVRQRTLLIEGDVRRPSLSQLFAVERRRGLCDLLRGDGDAGSCIYRVEGPGFWILPAGMVAGNPLELLQTAALATMIDRLASRFDWIVIDSPPVLPLADTSVWARLADGILLVTRQGTTKKKQLKRGLEAIEPKKLIGALLNSSNGVTESDYYYRLAAQSSANDRET